MLFFTLDQSRLEKTAKHDKHDKAKKVENDEEETEKTEETEEKKTPKRSKHSKQFKQSKTSKTDEIDEIDESEKPKIKPSNTSKTSKTDEIESEQPSSFLSRRKKNPTARKSYPKRYMVLSPFIILQRKKDKKKKTNVSSATSQKDLYKPYRYQATYGGQVIYSFHSLLFQHVMYDIDELKPPGVME